MLCLKRKGTSGTVMLESSLVLKKMRSIKALCEWNKGSDTLRARSYPASSAISEPKIPRESSARKTKEGLFNKRNHQ